MYILCSILLLHVSVFCTNIFAEEPSEGTNTLRANPNDTIKAKAGNKSDQKNIIGSTCDTSIGDLKAALDWMEETLLRAAKPRMGIPEAPIYRRSDLSDNDLKLLKPGRELMDEIIKNRGNDNYLANDFEEYKTLAKFYFRAEGMLKFKILDECRRNLFPREMERLAFRRDLIKRSADKVASLAEYYGSMTYADELLFKTILENVEGKHGLEAAVIDPRPSHILKTDPLFSAYHGKGKWFAAGQVIKGMEKTVTDRAGSPGHTTSVSKAWGYYSIIKSVKEILRGVYDSTKLWEAKQNRDAFFEEAEITAYLSGLNRKYEDIIAKQDETIRTINYAWNCKCR